MHAWLLVSMMRRTLKLHGHFTFHLTFIDLTSLYFNFTSSLHFTSLISSLLKYWLAFSDFSDYPSIRKPQIQGKREQFSTRSPARTVHRALRTFSWACSLCRIVYPHHEASETLWYAPRWKCMKVALYYKSHQGSQLLPCCIRRQWSWCHFSKQPMCRGLSHPLQASFTCNCFFRVW